MRKKVSPSFQVYEICPRIRWDVEFGAVVDVERVERKHVNGKNWNEHTKVLKYFSRFSFL